MNRPLVRTLGALALSSLLLAAGPAVADPPDHAKGWKQARHDVEDRHDHRHHYYPPHGYVVTRLPYSHRVVHHGGHRYYYGDGAWYRPYGSRFIVVTPPIGLTIPFRPDFYATLWFGGVPYYQANSVYFVWQPKRQGYVVTPPPW